MRIIIPRAFLIWIILGVSTASAQIAPRLVGNQPRIIPIAAAHSPVDCEELSGILRNLTGMQRASVDPRTDNLTMAGSAAQLKLAEWIVSQLDSNARPSATLEYKASDMLPDVVSIVFAHPDIEMPDIQELWTALRLITKISQSGLYSSQKAFILRGTSAQSAMAEWLIRNLDKTRQAIAAEKLHTLEFPVPGADDDIVAIFYLPAGTTALELQTPLTAVRQQAHIGLSFACKRPGAVIARGTPADLRVAKQVVEEFETAAQRK